MTFIQNNPLSRRKSSPCNANGDDKTISEVREEPGSSNAGKYPGVTKFCGPAGGAAKGTYPVEKDGKLDAGRISAAKSYADNAPDPAGIRACADRYEAQLKGKGEAVSRRSSSPLNEYPKTENPKDIAERMVRDGEMTQEQKARYNKAVSRRSSSPLNAYPHGADVPTKPDNRTGEDYGSPEVPDNGDWAGAGSNMPKSLSRRSSSPLNMDKKKDCPKGWYINKNGDCTAPAKQMEPQKEPNPQPSRRSSSPVNYSGLPGVNEDDILTDIESGRGESNWQAHHGDKKGVAPSRHGSMTGDQSAKSDYANFKDTDPNYHGHDGESHEDQSATRRDYMGNMGRHHIDPRTKK
jgi:hypothetical protein